MWARTVLDEGLAVRDEVVLKVLLELENVREAGQDPLVEVQRHRRAYMAPSSSKEGKCIEGIQREREREEVL